MDSISIYGTGALPQQNYTAAQRNTSVGETEQSQAVLSPAARENDVRSLPEMMQEAKEKAEEQKNRFRLPKSSTSYGDASIEAYSRLSRAKTRLEVNAASGYARRRISQLKAAKRQDSENAERIQAVINQLEKMINRAGKKKRDLDREKLIETRRSRSERENRSREAMRLKQELRHRRAMRIIRESGYIREAETDNRFQDQLSATRMELRAQAQALSSAVSLSTDVQQYSVNAAGNEPAAPEINVQA